MFLPVLPDSVLSDKAQAVSAKAGVSAEKALENIDIDRFLEEFLSRLETLDAENTGELPNLETGMLLPLELPEGNLLPPGQVQHFVTQALEHPGAMMSLLASLRQDLHSQPFNQNVDDAIESLPLFDGQDRELAARIKEAIGKYHDAGKTISSESDTEAVLLTDIDNAVDSGAETNRMHRILSNIEHITGNAQPNTNTPVRETAVYFNTVSSMSPVQHPSRVDAAPQVMTIQPQLFKPDWSEAFNSNLMVMVRDQVQSARMNLNPPELGPIEVRLSVQNDQTNIQFLAQHGAVRDAIEDAMPRLREMMAGSGVNLGDVNVSQHSSSDRSNTSADPEFADFVQEAPELAEEVIQTRIVSQSLVDHYI